MAEVGGHRNQVDGLAEAKATSVVFSPSCDVLSLRRVPRPFEATKWQSTASLAVKDCPLQSMRQLGGPAAQRTRKRKQFDLGRTSPSLLQERCFLQVKFMGLKAQVFILYSHCLNSCLMFYFGILELKTLLLQPVPVRWPPPKLRKSPRRSSRSLATKLVHSACMMPMTKRQTIR